MGLGSELAHHHRFEGLRSIAFGRTLELKWPKTPDFPSYGYVITRADLDEIVARRAEKSGVRVLEGHEAVEPLLERGLLRGAVVRDRDGEATKEITAQYVVVADGANSRFGRALGTSRDRSYPLGMAIRGYYTSPRHDENRGSRATSTSGTRPATCSRGTAGSSRWGTVGSTWASACSPPSTSGRRSTRRT